MTTPTTAGLELPTPGRWTAFGWFTFAYLIAAQAISFALSAGITGLAAARELQAAGREVEVLEAAASLETPSEHALGQAIRQEVLNAVDNIDTASGNESFCGASRLVTDVVSGHVYRDLRSSQRADATPAMGHHHQFDIAPAALPVDANAGIESSAATRSSSG